MDKKTYVDTWSEKKFRAQRGDILYFTSYKIRTLPGFGWLGSRV
jgi:hypothetical protein